MNSQLISKIKDFLKENLKIILFFVIFISIYLIYNSNLPLTDNFFKRGVVLEYAINNNADINEEKIKNHIANLKIKTGKFEKQDQILSIELYHLAKQKNTQKYNEISDLIFNDYKNSKLIGIKTLNEYYNSPYSQFVLILVMILVSLIINKIIITLIPKKYLPIKKDDKKENAAKDKEISSEEKTIWIKIKTAILKFLFEDDYDKENTNILKETVDTIVFVLVAVVLIRLLIGELRWIPSGSMKPTILEKDRVFVEKIHIPEKQIKRGDILVFYPPETQLSHNPIAVLSRLTGIFCKDIAYIKRVVGMPNDKFEIKYNAKNNQYQVYINNEPLFEPYIMSKVDWTPCDNPAVKFCGPFDIPKNHYFMMGDNRGNSQDGRFWGFLPQERIIGRAKFMFWPIQRMNVMSDRYYKLHEEKINDKYIEKIFILNRY